MVDRAGHACNKQWSYRTNPHRETWRVSGTAKFLKAKTKEAGNQPPVKRHVQGKWIWEVWDVSHIFFLHTHRHA